MNTKLLTPASRRHQQFAVIEEARARLSDRPDVLAWLDADSSPTRQREYTLGCLFLAVRYAWLPNTQRPTSGFWHVSESAVAGSEVRMIEFRANWQGMVYADRLFGASIANLREAAARMYGAESVSVSGEGRLTVRVRRPRSVVWYVADSRRYAEMRV